jgi:putative transcriptional regulator
MIQRDFSNLTGKILIATPFAMQGNVFYKSLIYMIRHGNEGSVGLIFNHPVQNINADYLFKKLDSGMHSSDLQLNLHLGGPVEMGRGFFLHTNERKEKNVLFHSTDANIAVSSSTNIVQDVASGDGPENSIFIIGYTGWNSKQLESEIESGLWLITEPDHDLVFSEDSQNKWSKALGIVGVSASEYIPSDIRC